jgi:purine-binding chemotaxis protein CheW
MPLVQGVINLEAAGRMVLVLNPSELLSRAEQGLLDTFEAGAGQGGADRESPDIEAGQGGS